LIVLNGAEPEVGDSGLALKVVDIDGLNLLIFLVLLVAALSSSLSLLLGKLLGVMSLELGILLCESLVRLSKVGMLARDDLGTELIQGLLLCSYLLLDLCDLCVELVRELAALVGEDLEDLEA